MLDFSLKTIRNHNHKKEIYSYLNTPLDNATLNIPRRVYIYSTTGSKEINETMRTNSKWKFNIYNESSARMIVNNYCNHALDAYDLVVPISYKSDIFRLCVIYTFGGLYMDDDILPLRSLDEIARANNQGILLIEDRPHTNYWKVASGGRPVLTNVVGSTHRLHPFFKCTLDDVVKNVKRARNPENRKRIKNNQELTGPRAWTRCAKNYRFTLRFIKFSDRFGDPCFAGKSKDDLYYIEKAFPNRHNNKHYSYFNKMNYIKDK